MSKSKSTSPLRTITSTNTLVAAHLVNAKAKEPKVSAEATSASAFPANPFISAAATVNKAVNARPSAKKVVSAKVAKVAVTAPASAKTAKSTKAKQVIATVVNAAPATVKPVKTTVAKSPVGPLKALTDAERATISVRIKRFRKHRGLSQLEVAQMALKYQKSHAIISRLERRVLKSVPAAQLNVLAAFMGTTVKTLLAPVKAAH